MNIENTQTDHDKFIFENISNMINNQDAKWLEKDFKNPQLDEQIDTLLNEQNYMNFYAEEIEKHFENFKIGSRFPRPLQNNDKWVFF